jgi:hypothetical protein
MVGVKREESALEGAERDRDNRASTKMPMARVE